MKIGILTFHQSVNNGAVVQAYSLAKRIQQRHPDAVVEIIDYRMKKIEKHYSYNLKSYLKAKSPASFVKKLLKLMADPCKMTRLNKRTQVFHDSLRVLPLSATTIEDDGMDRVCRYINENYDVLVVGSDAIWNHVIRGFPNIYLPDSRITCPKLSYAASCYGMDFLKCSDDVRRQIGECLAKFDFIGVRDTATEHYVAWSECYITPVHTCDPTAFLDVNDLPIDVALLQTKLEKRGFDFQKPSIGIMGNSKMLKMIRSFYGKKYQIVSLYEYLAGADVQLYDLTPYEWAYVFRYFKLVFTTYFHGTMLSLRNGVPLICISLRTEFGKKHTPKTLDVLQRLGFDDWYFETDYVSQNVEAIREKADVLLSLDCKDKILAAIEREADSYFAFDEKLSSIIDKESKQND